MPCRLHGSAHAFNIRYAPQVQSSSTSPLFACVTCMLYGCFGVPLPAHSRCSILCWCLLGRSGTTIKKASYENISTVPCSRCSYFISCCRHHQMPMATATNESRRTFLLPLSLSLSILFCSMYKRMFMLMLLRGKTTHSRDNWCTEILLPRVSCEQNKQTQTPEHQQHSHGRAVSSIQIRKYCIPVFRRKHNRQISWGS